jgi:hypothetical protein
VKLVGCTARTLLKVREKTDVYISCSTFSMSVCCMIVAVWIYCMGIKIKILEESQSLRGELWMSKGLVQA